MLAIEVNNKWNACPSKGSTQAPVHPHIKLSKYQTQIIWTWWKLAWRYSMCPRERFSLYKNLSRLVLWYKKDWATLLHLIYFHCLLPVTNYLITKLSITDNFSVSWEYLAENRLSFPSSPRWVRHSYLSKGPRLIPYTCGSSILFSGTVAGEWSAFGKWNLVRKHLYTVLKFTVTCYYGI